MEVRKTVAFFLFCFFGLPGQSRADVTGIALSRSGTSSGTNTLTTLAITFQTSSDAASFNLNSLALTTSAEVGEAATFRLDSESGASISINSSISGGTATFNLLAANFGQNLGALTTHTIYIQDLNSSTYATTDANIASGELPFNFSGETTIDHTVGVAPNETHYYNKFSLSVTAVPEPGTLILTGATLGAGAAGAWWKRRRKRLS